MDQFSWATLSSWHSILLFFYFEAKKKKYVSNPISFCNGFFSLLGGFVFSFIFSCNSFVCAVGVEQKENNRAWQEINELQIMYHLQSLNSADNSSANTVIQCAKKNREQRRWRYEMSLHRFISSRSLAQQSLSLARSLSREAFSFALAMCRTATPAYISIPLNILPDDMTMK